MKFALIVLFFLAFSILFPKEVLALENPLSVPNNRIGIHILFPEEIVEVAKLVNSNGGDWGYVTIPIQVTDLSFEKWQKFMKNAKKLHMIPLLRLATEGNYFNTKIWRKPTPDDISLFSNFLSRLDWPTKNRYIIVFNEVNRFDEWGGEINPFEYAKILSYATTVFKSKSQDFFIISAGLDNAAPNSKNQFVTWSDYLTQMNDAVPGIFFQIDGIASHSYPNPGFSQPPTKQDAMSIATFRYERQLIEEITHKRLPVFITETGWSQAQVADKVIADYYIQALIQVWKEDEVVALTPFLYRAGTPPFNVFSLILSDGSFSQQLQAITATIKVKGKPVLPPQVLSAEDEQRKHKNEKASNGFVEKGNSFPKKSFFQSVLSWLFG